MRIVVRIEPTDRIENFEFREFTFYFDPVPDRIRAWVYMEIENTFASLRRLISFSQSKGEF